MLIMRGLRQLREERGYSQRRFAERAGLSFRGLQLLEAPDHDMRLSSVQKIAKALHLPEQGIEILISDFLSKDKDSIAMVSLAILCDGEKSWPLHLFNFVDAFRATKKTMLIASAPTTNRNKRIECLLASTVETLCREFGIRAPGWCRGVVPLEEPWFVAGMESLKAMALAESPPYFRKRNIFVLNNFLDRA